MTFVQSPLKGIGLFRPYSFACVPFWGAGFRYNVMVIGPMGLVGSSRGEGGWYSLREKGWKGCGDAWSTGFLSA